MLRPSSGEVAVDGVELTDDTVRADPSRVGLVFQDPDDQLFMTTRLRRRRVRAAQHGAAAAEVDARVHEALHAVGLADEPTRPAQHLSFGQRKRAALADRARRWTRACSCSTSRRATSTRERGAQDDRAAARPARRRCSSPRTTWTSRGELCDRAVVLDGGRVVADGPATELLTDEALLHGARPRAARATAWRPEAARCYDRRMSKTDA